MNTRVSLVLVGFITLFLELALIRWLPGNVVSLAYFSNIVLIAAFVGLGIGFLLPKAHNRFNYFAPCLFLVVAASIALQNVWPVISNNATELLWSIYIDNALNIDAFELGIIPTLVIVFLLVALPFILLGDKIGFLMRELNRPLEAYSLEISGSLLGVLAFTLCGFLGGLFSSPLAWFFIVAVASLWLVRTDKRFLVISAILLLFTCSLVWWSTKDSLWSPYYRIDVVPQEESSGLSVYANRFFFQQMVDFDSNVGIFEKYRVPYELVSPQTVLILGAGSGNDASVALKSGASQITAVEIDSTIASFGKTTHPDLPYLDERVRVVVDDARAFLAKDNATYDMVVIGTLDAHALLSARSTVRLDNFVYTAEALEEVKGHLNEHGLAALQFSVPEQWLTHKLVKTVQQVFGQENVVVLEGDQALFNLMILAGPRVADLKAGAPESLQIAPAVPESIFSSRNIATDDWPYLYLREHAISSYYLQAIGLLLLVSIGAIVLLVRRELPAIKPAEGGIFLLLGAGFLLLETKSITTFSLLFGSTWLVNSFVFASILGAILLANLFISRVKVPLWVLYTLLCLSLIANYVTDISIFLEGQKFWSLLSASLILALPLLFASMVFSSHIRNVSNIRAVFGLNLLGAVLGGFLEYASMLTGLNALYLIAIGMYGASYTLYLLSTREESTLE